MSIDKLPSGKWRVRVEMGHDSSGKRLRAQRVVPTKKEAKAVEHMLSELHRTDALIRERIRFDDFVWQYYLPYTSERVRYTTLAAYKRDIGHLLPAFGHMMVDEIDKVHIQSLINTSSTYKVAKNSRDCLRQILNYAVELGFIKINPARAKFDFPAPEIYPEEHNGTWLTTFEQHDQFLATIDHPRFKLIAELGLGLGLRRGEIFGLDWEDIDLEKRIVHIQRTYARQEHKHELMSPKTKKSNRYIPLRKELANYLSKEYELRGHPTGAVVVSPNKKRSNPVSTSQGWLKYLRENNLEEVSILNMRHSFATACMNAGMDVTKVSKLLGHTNITTTVSRYVRYKPEDMVKDFDALFE